VVGLPALRLRGLYLAVVTLVFALSVSAWLLNDRFFSWIPKERLNRLPLFGRVDLETPTRFYAFAIVVLLLVLAGVRGIRRSRTGRAIIALRDNERGAQAFAVPVIAVKLAAFTISGAIAGVAGALFAQLNHSFDISSYDPSRSLTVFSASIVGGLGAPFGAVLGAVWIKGAEWFITADEWRFLSTAVGQLIVLLVVPGGLAALIIRVRDDLAGRLLRRADARTTTPDTSEAEVKS
jgi:branched-chain amino acid transport system permease protein